MRHVYVNRATYILSTLLILFTVLFAVLRSNNIVLFVQDVQAAESYEWFERGAEVFEASCASCHGSLEYIPRIFNASGGREYLKFMIVHGVEGELVVDGEVTTDSHPGFDDESNEALAAVLNYMLVAWDNEADLPSDPELYEADEIEAVREEDITPEEVFELRPDI